MPAQPEKPLSEDDLPLVIMDDAIWAWLAEPDPARIEWVKDEHGNLIARLLPHQNGDTP